MITGVFLGVLDNTVARNLTTTLWHSVFETGNLYQLSSLQPTKKNGMIHNRRYPKSFAYICMSVYFSDGLGKKLKSYCCIWLKFVVSCSGDGVNKTDSPCHFWLYRLAQEKGLNWPLKTIKMVGLERNLRTLGLKILFLIFFLTAGQVKRVCGKFCWLMRTCYSGQVISSKCTLSMQFSLPYLKDTKEPLCGQKNKENLEMLGLLCLEK